MYTKKKLTNCPHCGAKTRNIKAYRKKKINHTLSIFNRCIINLKYIRYDCKKCKHSFYEDISQICDKYYRHTSIKLNNIIDNLHEVKMSVKDRSKIYDIDYRLVNRLFEIRVNKEGLNNICTLPKNIGIDEFKGNMIINTAKGNVKSKYQVQITDLDTSKIIVVLPFKDSIELEKFFKGIKNKEEQ